MKIIIFFVSSILARSFSQEDRFQSDSGEILSLGEDVKANKEGWIEGLSSYRQRRSYSDIEESVGSFLDDVDFYLEKVGIIRYIILDVRQLYAVLKQDVLYLQNQVEQMQSDGLVTATEVLNLIDDCTRFIDHLILYFDVILQGWSELLWPWIDFDKNVVMDWLDYVLRLTQFIQNSSGIIDIIVNLFN